ncbi:MAG TPA: helix-turn-helix transcriptional regulator [Candidatus Merdenecus merdavium]|nr:helix-turn-helix transcriptional regulator [Candidatus Merdenecus merdavium]
MEIGEVIREYRKRKDITQEEMARRLGVTTPAVNKWENGNSQPDIRLLPPIARLLDITLDTLLSFEKELTVGEINNIIYEIDKKLKHEPFEEVFQWVKMTLEQYPNCEQLIWQAALLLDVWHLKKKDPDAEKYENYINSCYERALDSEDENIRNKAADCLFEFYSRKEQFEKAEDYLSYFSNQNPIKKIKQAFIYSKTNRRKEAYQAYEELLFEGYDTMNRVFQSIYFLAMEDEDKEKAYKIVEKQSTLANVFEMGEYHEVHLKLDLAISEKDVKVTIETMERMLSSLDTISGFINSTLYEHMAFKKNEDFTKELHKNLLTEFSNEETFGYLKGNKQWKKLINSDSTFK